MMDMLIGVVAFVVLVGVFIWGMLERYYRKTEHVTGFKYLGYMGAAVFFWWAFLIFLVWFCSRWNDSEECF